MNLKRIVAGVAAAATMLGGLAVGAVAANAADGETITVSNAQDGMAFTAYQLATFSDIQANGDTIESLYVTTADSAKTALTNAMASIGQTVEDPYKDNPAAQAATFDEATLRALADKLKDATADLGTGYQSGAIADESTTIAVPAAGWYLVTSPTDGVAPAIVTSTVAGYAKIARTNGEIAEANLGQLVAKHNLKPTPEKTVDTKDKNVVGVGDTLTYTIKSTLPSRQADAVVDSITYHLHDKPSKGLEVKAADVEVKVGDTVLTAGDDYTLEGFTDGTFTGNGTDSFHVNLDKYVRSADGERNAGQKVVVTYTATVNGEAAKDPLTNYVDVATDPNETLDFKTKSEDVKVGRIEFNKVGVGDEAAHLAGAVFQVKSGERVLSFTDQGNGTYTYAPNGGAGTVTEVTSPADGKVTLLGMPQGTYGLAETKAPEHYSNQFLATATIEVNGEGDTSTWDLAGDSNALGLVTGTKNAITVKNVKSITQLPLTGAAGISLLVAVALLLGGAAALIAVRTGSLRRQLRG